MVVTAQGDGEDHLAYHHFLDLQYLQFLQDREILENVIFRRQSGKFVAIQVPSSVEEGTASGAERNRCLGVTSLCCAPQGIFIQALGADGIHTLRSL